MSAVLFYCAMMYETATGCLFFNKKMAKSFYNTLMAFCKTRHYKRSGKEQEDLLYIDPNDNEAPDWRTLYSKQNWNNAIPVEIMNYSTVANGAPSLYCHWKPSCDRMGLEFDGCEKAENLLEWLLFLIQYFIKPNGYSISGEIVISYKDDCNTIVIENNEIVK